MVILRINGEEFLDVVDDGVFILVFKFYFVCFDEFVYFKFENFKFRVVIWF